MGASECKARARFQGELAGTVRRAPGKGYGASALPVGVMAKQVWHPLRMITSCDGADGPRYRVFLQPAGGLDQPLSLGMSCPDG